MVKFSNEVFTTICERIAKGESLRKICDDEGITSKTTVLRWMQDDDEGLLRDQYARAREMQADHYAEEIIEISDESANDTFIDEHGNERNNNEIVARSRLRVDSRKWLAGKLRPKVYGEKIVQEHSGPGGGPIETSEVSAVDRIKDMIATNAKRITPEPADES